MPENCLQHGGWTFHATKSHIATSDQRELLEKQLNLSSLPEMVYANNSVRITHEPTNSSICFEPAAALASTIDSDLMQVQCAAASKWKCSRSDNGNIPSTVPKYDWTFSPSYHGTFATDTMQWDSVTDPECSINFDLLRAPDPILFFDHVLLFEDELHDHGVSQLYVKMRVMPKCFFVLLRHWLRVDGVLLRVNDTRTFHEFNTNFVIRERKLLQSTFDELEQNGRPSKTFHYVNDEDAIPHLELRRCTVDRFDLKAVA